MCPETCVKSCLSSIIPKHPEKAFLFTQREHALQVPLVVIHMELLVSVLTAHSESSLKFKRQDICSVDTADEMVR